MKFNNTLEQPNSLEKDFCSLKDLWCIVLLLGLGILVYLPWLGSYGILDPTDSFFLESAREMIEKHQYLLAMNNYDLWLDKPILYFWLVILSYKVGGISLFWGRLPAVLSAISTSVIMYYTTRPFLKQRAAFLAAVIFLVNPLSSVIGHVCLTDMTLTMLITGAILCLFRAITVRSRSLLILGYVFIGLGMLCKGPIAIILPGLAFLFYFLLNGFLQYRSSKDICNQLFQNIFTLKPLIGIIIICLLCLPWYVIANKTTNGEFFYKFFVEQNFGRMVGIVNHQEPWWFYIPVIICGFFPWSLFGFGMPVFFSKSINNRAINNKTTEILKLAFCWLGATVLLFTAIKTKLPTYILPCIPACAILTVIQLEAASKKKLSWKFLIPSILMFITIAVTLVIHSQFPLYIRTLIQNCFGYGLLIIFLLAFQLILMVTCFIIKNKKDTQTLSKSIMIESSSVSTDNNLLDQQYNIKINYYAIWIFTLAVAIACSIFVPNGMMSFYKAKQEGFNKLVNIICLNNGNVAILGAEEPSIPWFTHKKVYRVQEESQAQKLILQQPQYLLVPREMLFRLTWFHQQKKLISTGGKWYLYEIR